MSLARAFTTKRNKRPEVSSPMPYRDGQVKFSSGTIKRGKISGPVQLLSTTNMLAYNAPDLTSGGGSATSSSSSSLRSPDDSELAFSPPQSSFDSPITSPDESPRTDFPVDANPQESFFPKRSATVANHPRSSGSTTSSTEAAPSVPRRALSHTKRSHQALARQRSLSRLEPPPLSASRASSQDSPTDASFQPEEAHPFGKELEQVNEVAEEFGGSTRAMSEEERILLRKGLKKFSVNDYLAEVDNVYGSIFDDQLGPISAGPWL